MLDTAVFCGLSGVSSQGSASVYPYYSFLVIKRMTSSIWNDQIIVSLVSITERESDVLDSENCKFSRKRRRRLRNVYFCDDDKLPNANLLIELMNRDCYKVIGIPSVKKSVSIKKK